MRMFERYTLILNMIAINMFYSNWLKFYIWSGTHENTYLVIDIFTKEDNVKTCMLSNVSTLKVNILR